MLNARTGKGRHPVIAGDGRRVRGRDQHPADRALGPQALHVRRVGQVIEHHQPRPAGLAEPADEAGRHGLGVAHVIGTAGRRRLGVGRQHRGPARRRHPEQQVYPARSPQGFSEERGELSLAARPDPVGRTCRGVLPGDERHAGAGNQSRAKRGGGLGPRAEAIGQRGNRAGSDRPNHSRCLADRSRGPHPAVHGPLPVTVHLHWYLPGIPDRAQPTRYGAPNSCDGGSVPKYHRNLNTMPPTLRPAPAPAPNAPIAAASGRTAAMNLFNRQIPSV